MSASGLPLRLPSDGLEWGGGRGAAARKVAKDLSLLSVTIYESGCQLVMSRGYGVHVCVYAVG